MTHLEHEARPGTDVHAPMQPSKLHNYNSTRGAEAYKRDHQRKLHRRISDRRERTILQRYLTRLGPCQRILDLPCGHGRLSGLLGRHCQHLIEGDWSFSMVQLSRRDHGLRGRSYLRASALEIPLPDRSVDLAVSFRLNHHLETTELREQHLRELFRVSDRAVIATWFSHTSLKAVLRRLQARFLRKRHKHTLHNARVRAIARECGFEPEAATPLFLVGSGHVLGLFVRREPPR
jgi:ubiquinone/menaquinone biosynthesis C-methylase UbiE